MCNRFATLELTHRGTAHHARRCLIAFELKYWRTVQGYLVSLRRGSMLGSATCSGLYRGCRLPSPRLLLSGLLLLI